MGYGDPSERFDAVDFLQRSAVRSARRRAWSYALQAAGLSILALWWAPGWVSKISVGVVGVLMCLGVVELGRRGVSDAEEFYRLLRQREELQDQLHHLIRDDVASVSVASCSHHDEFATWCDHLGRNRFGRWVTSGLACKCGRAVSAKDFLDPESD